MRFLNIWDQKVAQPNTSYPPAGHHQSTAASVLPFSRIAKEYQSQNVTFVTFIVVCMPFVCRTRISSLRAVFFQFDFYTVIQVEMGIEGYMSDFNSIHREGGFTLIELMIVIVILGVVVTLAAPSFNQVIKTNRLRTETHKFVSVLNLAKSEAVKRNLDVVICNGADCTGQLQGGWQIFSDFNSNGVPDPNEVIRVSDGLSNGFTMTNADGTTPFASRITHFPDGSAAPAQEFFLICPPDKDSDAAWGVTLNAVGNPTIKAGGAGTCPS